LAKLCNSRLWARLELEMVSLFPREGHCAAFPPSLGAESSKQSPHHSELLTQKLSASTKPSVSRGAAMGASISQDRNLHHWMLGRTSNLTVAVIVWSC
jgi:hypothetical protein